MANSVFADEVLGAIDNLSARLAGGNRPRRSEVRFTVDGSGFAIFCPISPPSTGVSGRQRWLLSTTTQYLCYFQHIVEQPVELYDRGDCFVIE